MMTRNRTALVVALVALLSSVWTPAAFGQIEAEQIEAAATVTLKVGSGQQYGSLQAALDAIPGTVSTPHKVLVYPGTYSGESTLAGKNVAGGSISIENAQATKPVFSGATLVDGGQWAPTQHADVWSVGRGGIKAVTDRTERLVRVSSIAELARTPGAWVGDGSATYVRLSDLASPNTRALALTTADYGLRVVGVPVAIKGLRFEHYASIGVWVQDAGGTVVQSVQVDDIGSRGSDDGGVVLSGSPNVSVVNVVASSVRGAGVRVGSSSGTQVLNGSFFRNTSGVRFSGSTGGLVRNNAFGLGHEAALVVDAASESGLVTSNNVYGNVTGFSGIRSGSTYEWPQAGPGGEASSVLADPKFRSTTSAYPTEVSWMFDTMHDQDAGNNNGNGWATNTNAANLAWDWGFLGQAYMDAYRATGDTYWLAKIVSQSDQIWAQAYDNPSSPGAAADGKLGWSTSRYAVALIKPATITSAAGADIRIVDSSGTVLGSGQAQRVYGPGNGDGIPTQTLELRFGSGPAGLAFEIWDVTSGASCIRNCGFVSDNWNDGTPPGGNVTDADISALAQYTVTWQLANAGPTSGDKYQIVLKAKKQLEYSNIDARVTAPMADFAAAVLHDPTIQQVPVAGSTMLAKAQDYLAKIDANIFAKWQPYFRDLSTTPGNNGLPGGIYVYPSDEQYALPSNTNPLNMQADMGRLWAHMYQATGDPKYSYNAIKIAQFIQSRMLVQTRSGQEYYYWEYWSPTGSWDTWTSGIPEDINHGGLVADFADVMREAGLAFSDLDLVRFRNTFGVQAWDKSAGKIYYYINRTVPLAYSGAVYWLHGWVDLPGSEPIAQLVEDIYSTSSYSTTTGVVYYTLADAARKLSMVPGARNLRVKPGSPTIRAGASTPYDRDFDNRSRSSFGTFDAGAFTFVPLTRLAGTDRYDTAVKTSQDRFPSNASAGGVVLTRGDVFADGLSGAPFAAFKNASVLLTKPTSLPSNVLAEIQRVVAPGATVWILGGQAAVSQGIADQLTSLGFTVERIEGADRYATAAAVAGKMPVPGEVFIANGTSFADPLAASAVASMKQVPILLAKKSSLPAEAKAYLTANPGLDTHLVGGKAVLDEKISLEIQALSNADRYGGSNRYGTAKLLAEGFFTANDSVGFATGTNFPDALSAGAHLGGPSVAGPLLLVQPTAVPKEVTDYLKANGGRLSGGFIFGGTAAVSQSVEDALESSL